MLQIVKILIKLSVTRLGDLLVFGQLFKAFGNNKSAQISHTFLGKFCKSVKIYHFWATFIDIWRFFLVTLIKLDKLSR